MADEFDRSKFQFTEQGQYWSKIRLRWFHKCKHTGKRLWPFMTAYESYDNKTETIEDTESGVKVAITFHREVICEEAYMFEKLKGSR